MAMGRELEGLQRNNERDRIRKCAQSISVIIWFHYRLVKLLTVCE